MLAIGARAVGEQEVILGGLVEDRLKSYLIKLGERWLAPDFGHPLLSEMSVRVDGW